jgi:hypothetical protein
MLALLLLPAALLVPLAPLSQPQHAARPFSARRHSSLRMGPRSGDDGSEDTHWNNQYEMALHEQIARRSGSTRMGKPTSVMEDLCARAHLARVEPPGPRSNRASPSSSVCLALAPDVPPFSCARRDSAWVLIFNPGRHDEGVYTLQGRRAYILAFERTDDAGRFAELLQAEGFDQPTPLCWGVHQLSSFCEMGEFEMSLVPQGSLITPPKKNEYDRDAFDRLKQVAQRGGTPEMMGEQAQAGGEMATRLDALLDFTPDNCDGDDCTLWSNESP